MFDALGLFLILTAGGDLISTELALQQPGVYELNPLMEHRAIRIPMKVGVTAGIYWSTEKLHSQHPRMAFALRLATVGLWGYATMHNLRQMR